ncbi:MAG: TROVE domain-containing protein [Desulfovibrio sp.]|jgi:hypothetical protein|nr:TROVE domain-containing protein [Desulfovibrio sp.]
MASCNVKDDDNTSPHTHEGAPAAVLSPIAQLKRSVLACLLWEDTFYEDGIDIADRIASLVPRCPAASVAELAIKAREEGLLRHAPLLLLRELLRHPEKPKVAPAIERVVQRADEPPELLAMYWREGKRPLAKQLKLGLAAAMRKFDAYQLAKYDRANPVRLRDVLFLTHARPVDAAQAETWRQLVDGTLPPPDTWEVGLSAGGDKKETFERLLRERKLGYMALLRNLRNMVDAGVDEELVNDAILAGAASSKALPFRYISAARAAPSLEPTLDGAMLKAMERMDPLPGRTCVLVDVSGSMSSRLSRRGAVSRIDAASALAILVVAIAEQARMFTFSDKVVEVPPRRGMALADAIWHSQPNSGTYLGEAIQEVLSRGPFDRLIVITDEQSHDEVPEPPSGCKGYMVNVAAYKQGVGYGAWMHIDGFSESIVSYVQELEASATSDFA